MIGNKCQAEQPSPNISECESQYAPETELPPVWIKVHHKAPRSGNAVLFKDSGSVSSVGDPGHLIGQAFNSASSF